jgi:lipopolysaccharide transport system permease protein
LERPLLQGTRPSQDIGPGASWQILDPRELWHFRDLLATLAGRDVKLRYRQTALGVIWDLIQPVVPAFILAVVFGQIAKVSSDGVPAFTFVYAGMLGWNAFSTTVSKSSSSLVQDAALLSKVYFPRLVLPLSTVLSTLVDFAIAALLLPVLFVSSGVHPGLGLVLLPIWLLMLIALAFGLGLWLSALMVTYRDVKYALPVLLTFLMYASPIAYPASAIPPTLRRYFLINPLAPLVEAMRWSLFNRGRLLWGNLAYATVFMVAILIWGAYVFSRMERRFADVI